MSSSLAYAQYYYALGNYDKALGLAKEGLRYLNGLMGSGAVENPKQRMTAALKVYDMIEKRELLAKEKSIELVTSKIGSIIALPDWAWQLEYLGIADFQDEYVDEMESWDSDLKIQWVPSEFTAMDVPNDEIVQSSLGDCSVVAGLIAMNSHGTSLALCRIYPQVNGTAVLSPSGKYLVCVTTMATTRVVEISDKRPVSRGSRPLHLTTSKGSAWPFLLEKSYMKLMGGYTFSGSHAAIDVYRLIGWLPFTTILTNWAAENPGKSLADLFGKWKQDWTNGQLILCLGTGPDVVEPLVPNHDYAIVSMAKDKAKVVNPWVSGTGSRWYTWDEISSLFSMLYLNFDKCKWAHRHVAHAIMSVNRLTVKKYDLGAYPQYTAHNVSDEPVPVMAYAGVKRDFDFKGFLSLQAFSCDHKVYSPQMAELLGKSTETNTLYTDLSVIIPPKSSVTFVVHSTELKGDKDLAVFVFEALTDKPVHFLKPVKSMEASIEGSWAVDRACSLTDASLGDNSQFYVDLDTHASQLDIYYIPKCDNIASLYSQLAVFYGDPSSTTAIPAPDVSRALAVNAVYNRCSTSIRLTRLSPGRYIVIPGLSQPASGDYSLIASCDVPVRIGKSSPVHSGLFERQYVCRGPDVEVQFSTPQPCDIHFQIDSEVEARLCVYDAQGQPLAASNNSEFKCGRSFLQINSNLGFCKVEHSRGPDLVLQAFATFPVDLKSADQP